MRNLTSTLEAAQKEPSSVPFVRVTVDTQIAHVYHLRWTRLYTGGELGKSHHAAVMPGDGSLCRARIDDRGPNMYYSRVANPGPSSDFSQWTLLGSQTRNAGIALAASGAKVLLAHVHNNQSDIHVRDSTDNGVSFGAEVTAKSGGGFVDWMAAVIEANGDAILFYSEGATLYALRRTSGSWGSPAAWSQTVNSITGIAVVRWGDNHVLVTGTDTNNNPRLWTAIYGEGSSYTANTWFGLWALEEAESGSGVSFSAPHMIRRDTHRFFFAEKSTGSVAYERPMGSWIPSTQFFAAGAWHEPVPFGLALGPENGLAIAGDVNDAWATTPDGVWRAPFEQAVDISQDVLEVVAEDRRTGGRAKVTLRNDDGRYNDLAAGPYAQIRHGAELSIGPGYLTSAGQEVSAGPRYWIDSWEYTSEGGRATLVLHASDGWGLLQRWHARRQHEWAAGSLTVKQILGQVFGRAAFDLLNVGASLLSGSHKPAFTIHPGENGLRASERLLAMLPDQIRVSGEFAIITEPLPTDNSDYAFGADHPIFRARYASPALEANRARVFGDGRVAEEFEWPDIGDQLDRLHNVHDLNLDADAEAQERAEVTLRQRQLAQDVGELVVPPSCGLQLLDVVTVTDPTVGLTAKKYRVVGLDLRYVKEGRPTYEQRVLLGNV